jgi:cyanophycinase
MASLSRRTLLAAAGAAAALVPASSVLASEEQAAAKERNGSLVLCGGGRPYDNEVLDAFFQLAGGRKANIVVVPTAHREMDSPRTSADRVAMVVSPWQRRGAAEVVVRHTLSSEAANAKEFIAPFSTATGVWLSGGDQSRLLRAYRGTEVHKALLEVLKRGGVIGGSSAGTAVQSELAILGEWNGRTVVDAGFNFLPGTVVDQHFVARARQRRLERVLGEHPSHVGYGVDEFTALVVRPDEMQVVGKSTVSYFQVRGREIVSRIYRPGEKLT